MFAVQAQPDPHPDGRIGIWLGGTGPRMLDLLGRRADGWIAPIMTDFASKPAAQDAIDRGAVAAGREPGDVRRVIQLVGEVSDTASVTARPEANTGSISTTAEHWARIIHQLLTLDRFDTVNLIPVTETEDQLHRFGGEVIPRVRGLLEGS